ncbi:copper amine oxidase N-terminal domain-containing protein [Paenibacillus sp. RC67]|uniref:copper amine oxidase N-terminal domain-containing protein n=1 Tax=Paenibacillus sp. RC67 TaxID=3039392 RepID=UPI0024AE0C37|nr:copper amine oxidase N-terminal domain-containing protein [Paenibacillus sp. RC67]
MLKNLKVLSVTAMMMLGGASSAYAEQTPSSIDVYYAPIQFVFDSEKFTPPENQQGFIYEGSTYVPLRFISYSLNKAVRWDADTYTVTVEKPKVEDMTEISEYNLNTKVRNGAASEKVNSSNLKSTPIIAYKEKVSYMFDGQSKQIDSNLPGLIYQDSLYVPLRFFSEAVGKTIEWNPDTYTVSAKTQDEVKQETTETEQPKTEQPKSEIPATTPAVSGGSGGGGGSSSSSSNAQSAQTKAEEKLLALENSCRNALQPLADQYVGADDDEKQHLILLGMLKVSECQGKFDSILSEAASQGVSEKALDSYRARFDQVQADAIAKLKKKLGK